MNAEIGILIAKCGLATVYPDWRKLTALTANGLFDHLQKSFPVLGGYYTTRMAIKRV